MGIIKKYNPIKGGLMDLLKDGTSRNKGGTEMVLVSLRNPCSTRETRLKRDWPDYFPRPTDEEIRELAELSERNTGSAFFEKEKREQTDGEPTAFDR